MTDDPKSILSLVPEKVAEKAYDDAVAPLAKQVGKIGGDVGKTARLVLAPFQALAALQDRFERMMGRISERVPEKRRIEPPLELVGPIFEKLRYVPEDGELSQMFEEVLTRAIDKDAVQTVHPSFPHIIGQLSRDEALILYRLSQRDFNVVDTLDLNREANRFENQKIERSDIPTAELFQPEAISLYYGHLESLSLVTWPVHNQETIQNSEGVQTGVRRYSTLKLTEFGRHFATASIPAGGFGPRSPKEILNPTQTFVAGGRQKDVIGPPDISATRPSNDPVNQDRCLLA